MIFLLFLWTPSAGSLVTSVFDGNIENRWLGSSGKRKVETRNMNNLMSNAMEAGDDATLCESINVIIRTRK